MLMGADKPGDCEGSLSIGDTFERYFTRTRRYAPQR